MHRIEGAWFYIIAAITIALFYIGTQLEINPKDGWVCESTCQVHVDRVIDGDTFKTQGHRVRIATINAPELSSPYGDEAARCLQSLIEGRTITIIPFDLDQYGRTLVTVSNQRITC